MKRLLTLHSLWLPIAVSCTVFFLCACKKQESAPAVPEAAPALVVVTPKPSPSPSPEPVSMLTYEPEEAYPFPSMEETLSLGRSFSLGGTVHSNYPLTKVQVMITCDYNEDPFYPYTKEILLDPNDGILSYSLRDDIEAEGDSLNAAVRFSELQTGYHTLFLLAQNTRQSYPVTLASTRFLVLGKTWKRFAKEDFSNGSYGTASAFFGGDPERFLYRYQNGWDRYTIADPSWEETYITDFIMDGGEPWRIHVDAVPYYEKVKQYLYSASVRVRGANGDSGVLSLHQLIEGYYGSYLSRFTSSKKYVSHHALGTATDINAAMEPNKNTKDNKAVIDDDVRNFLVYNGIVSENGGSYYDYSYTGSYENALCGIPQTVINYIVYELAFYRAGFQWGHYYNSTSDGMHFTLTDNIKIAHDSPDGLRKVYEYYD